MNATVSGTDGSGQRQVSQIAASSPTQHDECPVATSDQHITYTTAQLHENPNDSSIQVSGIQILSILKFFSILEILSAIVVVAK